MDWEAFYNNFRKPGFIPGYEIQNRLGGGAFGDVYKARKQSIGKAYAIKFLKIEDDSQKEAVERELSQVRHFAAIDHPNLVTIEDMGTVQDVPYLIMGYAGEDTLARRLKSGSLPLETALLYFVQTCRGVLALHDRRLVHFDLKPSNIFLKGDVARVGDYGLSKLLTDGRMTLSFGRGTPMYMAPEMLRNRADQRADIYSLGVILYESLTGNLPFESEQQGGLILREEDTPPDFPADFPARMRACVERCLRLDPDGRYADVGELLVDIDQTARQGDSVRLDANAVPATSGAGRQRQDAGELKDPPTPGSTNEELRQTAAELARASVEVARGVWDGIRGGREDKPAPEEQEPVATNDTLKSVRRAKAKARGVWGQLGATVSEAGEDAREAAREAGADAREAVADAREAVVSAGRDLAAAGRDLNSAKAELERGTQPAGNAVKRATQSLRTRPRADVQTATRALDGAPAGAGAGGGQSAATIPVPPRVEGGMVGTLFSTVVVGLEVVVSLVGNVLRGSVRVFKATGDRLLRTSGGLIVRSVRLAAFVVLMVVLGALLMTVGLLFMDAVGAR